MNEFLHRHRRLWCAGVLALFLGHFLIRQIASASTNSLWGNESGIVFVWNHGIFSSGFYAAARSHIMAPPLDYVMGSLWWNLLTTLAPNWCQSEMELAMRTYPMLMMAVGLAALFIAAFILTNSTSIVLLLAALLVSQNQVLAYTAVELKFYAALFCFSSLSWVAFLWLRRELSKENPSRYPVWIWLGVSAAGVWAHFYVAVTIVAQFFLLALFLAHRKNRDGNLARFRHLRLGWMSAILFMNVVLLAAYVKFYANPPAPFTWDHCKSWPETFLAWKEAIAALLPFLGIHWLTLAFGLAALSWLFHQRPDFVALSSCLIMLGASLSTIFLPWFHSCRYYFWAPHYVNFIFPLAFLSLAQGLAWGLAALGPNLARHAQKLFFLASLIFFIVVAPVAGKPVVDGGDSLVRLRRTLQEAQLRVKGVIGILPQADRSLACTADGTWLGLTWELYLKGPEGLPKVLEFNEAQKNAGFTIISSAEGERFHKIAEPALKEEVCVDLSNPKNIVFRRPAATPAPANGDFQKSINTN